MAESHKREHDGKVILLTVHFHSAASTRVGNFLGANNPMAAKKSALIAICLGAAFQLVSSIIFVSLRHQWSELYDDDTEIIDLASNIVGIAGFVTVCSTSHLISFQTHRVLK